MSAEHMTAAQKCGFRVGVPARTLGPVALQACQDRCLLRLRNDGGSDIRQSELFLSPRRSALVPTSRQAIVAVLIRYGYPAVDSLSQNLADRGCGPASATRRREDAALGQCAGDPAQRLARQREIEDVSDDRSGRWVQHQP